jgi:hypothetical protein
MKNPIPYDAMEAAARQHAQLDKTTAVLWEEEAEVCAKLKIIDSKLQTLRLRTSRTRARPRDVATKLAR